MSVTRSESRTVRPIYLPERPLDLRSGLPFNPILVGYSLHDFMRICTLGLLYASLLFACQPASQTDPWVQHLEAQLDSLALDSSMGAISLTAVYGEQTIIMHKGTLLNGQVPPER